MSYDGNSIQVLEGREAVRKRPGMYIGGTDQNGLHHLIWEITDNSIDESLSGHASLIEVTLSSDKRTVTVTDNGRGIPVGIEPKTGKSALEVVFTKLHAGGKFDQSNYAGSGGLHGVGAAVTNFLSLDLTAKVRRDEKIHAIAFHKGEVLHPVKEVGTYSKFSSRHSSGTEITFSADPEIFPLVQFDPKVIADHLEMKTYINSGLRIIFKDLSSDTTFDFFHEDGMSDFMSEIIKRSRTSPTHTDTIHIRGEIDKGVRIRYQIACQWTEDTREETCSFVNSIPTHEGGTHEAGFREGLTKAVKTYLETSEVVPKKLDIKADDIREGLKTIVNIVIEGELQFQSQNKVRLNNPEVQPLLSNVVRSSLEQYLFSNKSVAELIAQRIVAASKARQASRSVA
jgi:DNA gyrase/topoisomerase IV subunit B